MASSLQSDKKKLQAEEWRIDRDEKQVKADLAALSREERALAEEKRVVAQARQVAGDDPQAQAHYRQQEAMLNNRLGGVRARKRARLMARPSCLWNPAVTFVVRRGRIFPDSVRNRESVLTSL